MLCKQTVTDLSIRETCCRLRICILFSTANKRLLLEFVHNYFLSLARILNNTLVTARHLLTRVYPRMTKVNVSGVQLITASINCFVCVVINTIMNVLNKGLLKNGTHEFSELVLARMSLLVDRSRSVFPLRLEFGEL